MAADTGLGALVLAVTATLVATQPAEAAHETDLAALSSATTNRALLAASPADTTIGFRLAKLNGGQTRASLVARHGTAGRASSH